MSSPRPASSRCWLLSLDGKCRVSKGSSLSFCSLTAAAGRRHMSRHRGDDLDDDYVPDELVASSGEEDAGVQGVLFSADEDTDGEHKEQRQSETTAKRKRKDKDNDRKQKKRKLADTNDDGDPPSIAMQSPQQLADYLSSMQARAFPDKSGLELLDMSIPETSIVDTSSWTESRPLDCLVEFIIKGATSDAFWSTIRQTFFLVLPTLHKRLAQKSKVAGSPTLLFIAGAALRVADVTRILKSRKLRGDKGGEVAKLFARHIKLAEHVTYLSQTKIGSAVGTPGRVGKLLCERDVLSVSQLTHIILDISYRDVKKRNLFDIPETRDEVFRMIFGAPELLQAIREGKIKVVLF
ncbi:U3-containing 90S pre-ribosomal complex subunit-domain containing protein [Scleroderma yunnanense]